MAVPSGRSPGPTFRAFIFCLLPFSSGPAALKTICSLPSSASYPQRGPGAAPAHVSLLLDLPLADPTAARGLACPPAGPGAARLQTRQLCLSRVGDEAASLFACRLRAPQSPTQPPLGHGQVLPPPCAVLRASSAAATRPPPPSTWRGGAAPRRVSQPRPSPSSAFSQHDSQKNPAFQPTIASPLRAKGRLIAMTSRGSQGLSPQLQLLASALLCLLQSTAPPLPFKHPRQNPQRLLFPLP